MDDIIELNFHNPELVWAMIEAMKFWITECDIDGFRCDLAFWVELDFWKEARKELDAIKPLFWLGELDPIEHPEYMGTFDAAYTWTWMHKTEDFYKEHLSLDILDTVLKQYDAVGDASMRTWFTSNHDENSWNGSEYEKYGDMAKPLAVFCCTWNGIPLIYSGQELPNLKRLKFFEKDAIDWTAENAPITIGLHDFYKTLLNLHSINPALRAGDQGAKTEKVKTSDDQHILAFLRKNVEKEVLVILNFSNSDVSFSLDSVNGNFRDIFSCAERGFSSDKSFQMNSWEYLVFEKL
jgi:glycosidase